eukprot:TRINITY_DN25925_c0_g1_i1.p1 TRINITY_DN25925_c0_g1~~TRINITY_DN25925_c0_g1_i1.p1  ORF type:complete len:105 (+),score=3.53 TRINITY_DN25925_c0_g1_i1:259-573(+)
MSLNRWFIADSNNIPYKSSPSSKRRYFRFFICNNFKSRQIASCRNIKHKECKPETLNIFSSNTNFSNINLSLFTIASQSKSIASLSNLTFFNDNVCKIWSLFSP